MYQKMKETKERCFFSDKRTKSIKEDLAWMHKHDFFHRDMKPNNILVHREAVKIAEFGLVGEIFRRLPFTYYV